MAFDQATRNKLQKFVSEARALLTEEFSRQLQNDYGMDPDTGAVSDINSLSHLTDAQHQTAILLRETMAHYQATDSENESTAILDRIVREQAFTVLNRICALRMAEARGILIESVARGYNSKGFQLYTHVAKTSLGETGDTFRHYLFSVFDEFAIDLAVLFDRYSPMGRLFPKETALLALLDKINDIEIESVWAEDETIGWMYQYFNSREERKKMRDESQAPRNSRELAVRNQFFTPRYVVEFLTDNTLGRTWYEMTQGNTILKNQCCYLVRRPNEFFLAKGEKAPEQKDHDADLTREELLKQPVYIEHRPMKDPREILMLDPACGSMHFGLYAFDLFEKIYEEAWDLQLSGQWQGSANENMGLLTDLYATKDALWRDIPRLIIEHNIHGIDIDPRAVQIAGLSLWLRAQRSWKEQDVKLTDRPQIRKSNIVCAEPMPGEKEFLSDFAESLKPRVLGQLLEIIFEKMDLAGEAGSLLKIEEEIADAAENAREEFNKELLRRKDEAGNLPGFSPKQRQRELFDFADLPDKTQFWHTAEEKILEALRNYAEQAEAESGSQLRLFAEDAAKGFAFIDLCRKRYDVVLMNPPFGEFSSSFKIPSKTCYHSGGHDILTAFIERGIQLLYKNGNLGSISSRTVFFMATTKGWREKVFLKNQNCVWTELGQGVLDNAMVETCMYVVKKCKPKASCLFLRCDNTDIKTEIKDYVQAKNNHGKQFIMQQTSFDALPGAPLTYWINPHIFKCYKKMNSLESQDILVRVGLQTGDDFRFIRVWWEAPAKKDSWLPHAKGGDNSPYSTDIHLVVNWDKDGSEMKAQKSIRLNMYAKSEPRDGLNKGMTFPYRTYRFSPAVLPEGTICGVAGMGIFSENKDIFFLLSLMNSSMANTLIAARLGRLEMDSLFQAGCISPMPLPELQVDDEKKLNELGYKLWSLTFQKFYLLENSKYFAPVFFTDIDSIKDTFEKIVKKMKAINREIERIYHETDKACFNLYNIPDTLCTQITDENIHDFKKSLPKPPDNSLWILNTLISILIGSVYGRVDIRLINQNRYQSSLPEPFLALSNCPPGMLQNADGLPAEPKDVPTDYPLRISWSGIMADDEGHPEDIIARIREAIEVIWKDKANDIEQEACEILGVRDLREYFAKPGKFFADHLKRYSKSRRQAPIYWPLSTPSGSYTLWLYYHRLTDQTLYTCVNNFVGPKLKQVSDDAENLRKKTNRSSQEEKDLEKLSDFAFELKDFHDELLRIAGFWNPDLNDGVQISAASLWKLFQLKAWQTRLKQTWKDLEKGTYDWAHLAYSIWPERVIRASHKDRSYAIAHDLENDLWEEIENGTDRQGNPKTKWVPKKLKEKDLKQLIAQKTGGNG